MSTFTRMSVCAAFIAALSAPASAQKRRKALPPPPEEPAAEPEPAPVEEPAPPPPAHRHVRAPEPEPEPAAEATAERMGGAEREIGGHRFVLPFDLDNAFMTDSFAFDQGFGQVSGSGTLPDGSELTYNFLVLVERLSAQMSLGNRVALSARAQGIAGANADFDSIIVVAAVVEPEASAGAKVRLFTAGPLQVTAGLQYRYARVLVISPLVGIQTAIMNQSISGIGSEIVHQETNSFVDPLVAVALGHGPVGLQASIRYSVSSDKDKSPDHTLGGAAATLDLRALAASIPVALIAELFVDRAGGDAPKTEKNVSGGIFYSGRRDLQLGLRYGTQLGGDSDVKTGTLSLGYFF